MTDARKFQLIMLVALTIVCAPVAKMSYSSGKADRLNALAIEISKLEITE